ncbi:MAG: flagellar M-ring protein FliF [Gammaproteobacteria bacterium]|nr:flagellar M-ring protein FliF [Gammaproteobacteria bacterium]
MAEATIFVEQNSPMAILRQAAVLLLIAASVALGAYVVMWARTPHYAMLYSDLSDRDLSQIADALKGAQILFDIQAGTGAVMVESSKLDEARMKLAAAGLPKGGARGFEMMDDKDSFGTSQFLEKARYQHAVEGELSRSIARIDNVRGARVHLAVPAESVFARQRRDPSASVILDLYAGHLLTPAQVGAITQLVSASVPNLPAARVTVVDSRGNLLTETPGDNAMAVTAQRFDYSRRLEQSLGERIEAILSPFVGLDGVRAQVTADLDFTATEQTRESFNPDLPAIRSEKLLEEQHAGDGPGGVPGALSNSPAGAASAPEQTAAAPTTNAATTPSAANPAQVAEKTSSPTSKRSQTTRNYELDRTISHTKPSLGAIRRLSVAVVVRNPAPVTDATKGKKDKKAKGEKPAALAPEQIERMTQLVKEAIGFDATRGDTVSVTSADFITPPIPEALPELPVWKQPWVWDVGKQVLGGMFVLFLVFGVLKPMIKSMLARPTAAGALGRDGGNALALPGADGATAAGGMRALPSAAAAAALTASGGVNENLDQVKQIVTQDPRVAAQVVKAWVGD